jgi:hypothetical protein
VTILKKQFIKNAQVLGPVGCIANRTATPRRKGGDGQKQDPSIARKIIFFQSIEIF